jgi:5-guanidino-2-oxopentanoate decarboxylase
MFETCRPRPAHLSFPLDVLEQPIDATPARINLPRRPAPRIDQLNAVVELLTSSNKIVFLFGGGALKASRAAVSLIEKTGALAVTTVAGKGIVPDSHPQSLGSSLQCLSTRKAIADADLVIVVGSEISEPDLYVTADAEASGDLDPELLSPRLKITGQLVRIDIDYETVIRDYPAKISILADAATTLESLDAGIDTRRDISPQLLETVESVRAHNRSGQSELESVHMRVLGAARDALPPNALIYADMTQIAYTGCVFYPLETPGCWHFPMGYGTLGYALPAAIGGSVACPGRACAAVVGDGGLMFTLQELATAVELELPMPIIVWDNDGLGEIADFMKARDIPQISVAPVNPDFTALAKSFGALAEAPESLAEITNSIRKALTADRPTLIHVVQNRFI